MRTVTVTWQPAAGRFVASGTNAGQVLNVSAPRTEEERRAAPEPTGFSPAELLLAGAGACSAWDVVEIMRKARQDLSSLEVRVEGHQASDPPNAFRRMTLHFHLVGWGIDRRMAERAVSMSLERYCTVVATLREDCEVDWRVTLADEAARSGVEEEPEPAA